MTQRLIDIAEIQIGYQFRGKIELDPKGTHRVVQIKDIDDDQCLRLDGLDSVTPARPATKYLVSQGDVLFLSRGHRNYAVPILEPLDNTIVASYFYILRPKARGTLPAYLAWWINQHPVQMDLMMMSGGSHMPLVRRADFEQIKVEIPDVSTQGTIIKLDELMRRERQLIRKLEERRQSLLASQQTNINWKCLRAAGYREHG